MITQRRQFPVLFLLILLLILLPMMTLLSGCKPGKEQEAIDLLNTIFPDLTPTPTPTPTPTATPNPTPTPEVRVGFHFSDLYKEQMASLWPPANTPIDSFDPPYVILGENNVQDQTARLTYQFHTTQTIPQMQEYFGQRIFGLTLTETYRSCQFIGEADGNGNPLPVDFAITETPDGNVAYIQFTPDGPIPLAEELYNEYWPGGGLIHEALTDDALEYRCFAYDPFTEDAWVYCWWQLSPDTSMEVFDWYREEFADQPDFTAMTPDPPMAPRLSFTYDIMGDGQTTVTVVQAQAYGEAGLFGLTFGSAVGP